MSFLSFSSRASGGKIKKARPKSGRGAKLPAVPPEFRLKANTLTAYNGACRIKLLTHKRVLIRSAPKGKAETKRNMLLPAKGALSVKPIFVSRLYQRIFYTQKLYHILDNLSSILLKKIGSPQMCGEPRKHLFMLICLPYPIRCWGCRQRWKCFHSSYQDKNNFRNP